MLTELRLSQLQKACSSISLTDEGIITAVSFLQPWNAPYLITVTEDGIVAKVIGGWCLSLANC